MIRLLIVTSLTALLSLSTIHASEPKTIHVESVVMGTDGQMRVRINGQFLTRQSEKDGIKVLDMTYETVKVEVGGQVLWLKPNQLFTLDASEN